MNSSDFVVTHCSEIVSQKFGSTPDDMSGWDCFASTVFVSTQAIFHSS